ncbi:RidA family protein [Gaopeijia maritima]|uniref:RidA family protein n=1 Tax=Gaopeijia maritima TaxID=3119007 RepID=UPI003869FB5C
MHIRLPALLLVLLAGCTPVELDDPTTAPEGVVGPIDVEYLATPEQQALGLPFSEAVRVGPMLYLSGQIGNLPGTLTLVEGGIQAETRQTMDNIRAILERYGSSLDRVVKCTVMVADMAEWPALNEVYVEYFPGPKPARSALGANGLALGARVEIECWATVD